MRDLFALNYLNYGHPAIKDLYDGPGTRAIQHNRSSLHREMMSLDPSLSFYSLQGEYLGDSEVMRIDPTRVIKAMSWIIRGLTFHHYGIRLPSDAIIDVASLDRGEFIEVSKELYQPAQCIGPIKLGQTECSWISLFQDQYHAGWAICFYWLQFFLVSVSHPSDPK